MKCAHRSERRGEETVGQDGGLVDITVMCSVPLNNGLNCSGGRGATDLFEGAPHVHGRGVLAEVPPAVAFCRDDCIPKSAFACVEGAPILRGQCALPSTSCSKVGLSELGEVG